MYCKMGLGSPVTVLGISWNQSSQEMGLVLEAVTRDVPQSTGPPAGQPIEPCGTKQTLKEMVDAIKQELELGGSMASVIRQANELMGLAPYSLTLPEQAEQLMSRLGV